MKIISKYVLREHLGPLAFAFTALTSLMLLNFISRQFGELVGKGLPASVIGQFFMLSIPFTVALTIPMSVLVAVLYAYSRLASENEVTALKASGVSPWRLVAPAMGLGLIMSIGLLAFLDQVLPRANHSLKTLQNDISSTKPTLLLKEQVINTVSEGRLYLKAGKIDQSLGRMKEVVIYDLGNPQRRRTIYADSGLIAFAANKVDLNMDLFHGQMQEIATDKPSQLDRLFYTSDRIKVKDVGRDFHQSKVEESSKGDREMGVCEMQNRLWLAQNGYELTKREYDFTMSAHADQVMKPGVARIPEPRGLGYYYCHGLTKVARLFTVKSASAREVGTQDTIAPKKAQDTVVARHDTTKAAPLPKIVFRTPMQNGRAGGAAPAASGVVRVVSSPPAGSIITPAGVKAAMAAVNESQPASELNSRQMEAKLRLEISERARDRFQLEIQKKFSLAAACLIFCIVAPPIALRFPRGGVGLVIGVSLAVFALYYVGLIGGEAVANAGIVKPVWAMWAMNILMTAIGLVMMFRLRRDTSSGRGGGIREWLDTRRMLREEARVRTRSMA